jgi:hypothetical protein
MEGSHSHHSHSHSHSRDRSHAHEHDDGDVMPDNFATERHIKRFEDPSRDVVHGFDLLFHELSKLVGKKGVVGVDIGGCERKVVCVFRSFRSRLF